MFIRFAFENNFFFVSDASIKASYQSLYNNFFFVSVILKITFTINLILVKKIAQTLRFNNSVV